MYINMAGCPGQNGICTYNYHLWPKNDGEKWSRIFFYFDTQCRKKVSFVTEFVIWGKNLRDFKIKISRLLFSIIFLWQKG